MSSKTYYSLYNNYHSETTQLSKEICELNKRTYLQSAESLPSISIGKARNVEIYWEGRTSTVMYGMYMLKITYSAPQRVITISEQSDNYVKNLQPLSQIDPSTQKTYKRIALLGASNKTFRYAIEWLSTLREVATARQMWWHEPLVNLSIESEIVFEWWYKNKKVTVYILENTTEYIKVWGSDIDNEMEDGSATSSAEITYLWKWLVS